MSPSIDWNVVLLLLLLLLLPFIVTKPRSCKSCAQQESPAEAGSPARGGAHARGSAVSVDTRAAAQLGVLLLARHVTQEEVDLRAAAPARAVGLVARAVVQLLVAMQLPRA